MADHADIQADLKRVKLVVFDVDGVLTDGGIILDDRGVETKRFHVRDGSGIKYLIRSGLKVAFLSGRTSLVVRVRAAELGVDEVVLGAIDKLPAYEALTARLGLADEEVAYVGDDLPDLPVMRRAGVAAAVADAASEVGEAADVRLASRGGEGAAREFAEMVLRAQGKWARALERYSPGGDAGRPGGAAASGG